ncbi:MAG: hypothetical protein K9H84_00050 [Bacteroidales bacterium]|nr:hypothetical protein [Bacteroidales bacterium]
MDKLTINKNGTINRHATLNIPASKSISNRLLILSALSGKRIVIQNLSSSGDTVLLKYILDDYSQSPGSSFFYNCNNAGTVFRFLTAYFSFQNGEFILTGSERMKNRPQSPLFKALIKAGVKIRFLEDAGKPPVKIYGKKPEKTLSVTIDGTKSSQFINALLLTGPQYGLELQIDNKKVSGAYIDMTTALFDQLNIQYHFNAENTIYIPRQQIREQLIFNEYDWSSAAPWYVLTALEDKGYSVTINGLRQDSVQGDKRISEIFSRFGVQTIFQEGSIKILNNGIVSTHQQCALDVTDTPDLVPFILTTCAGLGINCILKGVSHLRYKESDRIAVMKSELQKTNNIINEIDGNTIHLQSNKIKSSGKTVLINSHNDHRIAMAFAPMVLRHSSIEILNPLTVDKSYPGFWQEIKKTGLQLTYKP